MSEFDDWVVAPNITGQVIDAFMATHDGPSLTYQIAIYEWRP